MQRGLAKHVAENFRHESAEVEAAMGEDGGVVAQDTLCSRFQMSGHI